MVCADFFDFSLAAPTDYDVVVCVELAWPSPGMTGKTPSGARCSQRSLVLGCWSLFHSWTGWDFCTDMWCGFFTRIFWCGFLDADFWVRIFLADFGVRIFSWIL